MPNLSTSSGNGWPLVALGAMLWGLDFLLRPMLLAHPGFSAVRVVLYEHIALAVIFVPLLIVRRTQWRNSSRLEWLSLVYIAWAGSALATVLLSVAYELGNALTATLLQKTQPLFAVALAGIFLGERRRPLFWGFFIAALIATYLLSFGFVSPLPAIGSARSASVACALGASLLWASCTVVGRSALAALPPPLVAGWRFVLALPLLAALNLSALVGRGLHEPSAKLELAPLLLLAGIVLLPDLLGMVLYYAGLKSTPASLATLAELAYPVAALLIGALYLHQKLAAGQWLGIIVLIVALQLIQSSHVVNEVHPSRSRIPISESTDKPGLRTSI